MQRDLLTNKHLSFLKKNFGLNESDFVKLRENTDKKFKNPQIQHDFSGFSSDFFLIFI